VRAQHVSFSDFPLLVPDRFNSAPALPMAQLIDRLVLAFLHKKMDMDGVSSNSLLSVLSKLGSSELL
jgi:hypothetical protein